MPATPDLSSSGRGTRITTEQAGWDLLTKPTPHIVPSSIEDIRQAIAAIENLDPKAATIEEIKDHLTVLFRGFSLVAPVFEPGFVVYRARVFDSGKPEWLSEISGPPPNRVLRNQRCNRAGESMFYSSAARNAPFFECHVKAGQHVALSKWRTTQRLLVNHVAYTPDTFVRLRSTRDCPEWNEGQHDSNETEANRLVHDFLASKFTEDVQSGNEDSYKLTIAITEKLIPDSMFGGLLYPTIPMAANADNLALKPAFVSTGLSFVRVEYIAVRRIDGMKIHIDILDSAARASDDGRLQWTGRRGKWELKNQGDQLSFTVEHGEWVARDPSGNIVEPE